MSRPRRSWNELGCDVRNNLETKPRVLVFLGGIGVVLLLLAPFLLDMIRGPADREELVELLKDAEDLPVTGPAGGESGSLTARPITRYAGLALNDPPARLLERVVAQEITRPGDVTQVFTARNQADWEYLWASYDHGALKELLVVHPPRAVPPEELADDLIVAFGEASTREGRLDALPAEVVELLVEYPTQRHFTWFDGVNQAAATIYSRLDESGQYHCVLVVRVRAADWLPRADSSVAPARPDPRANAPVAPPLPALD